NRIISARPFATARAGSSTAWKGISVEVVGQKSNVAIVSITDPAAGDVPLELCEAVAAHEVDASIRSTVVLLTSGFALLPQRDYGSFNKIADCAKPTIALVDGEIGGVATELAMSCDIIYASDRSSFALDQILLGSIPGSGGTQRLPRAIGKSRAMEMVLSGDPLPAVEAKQAGLVSKVIPHSRLLKVAIRRGEIAAEKSSLIQPMAKEAVAAAYETTLREGLYLESKLFEATFATRDRREGMAAHFESRKPEWSGE
ncbi:hypothetical protein PMAYCL1PPCAC_27499, partial [Pristionchus mayeri]